MMGKLEFIFWRKSIKNLWTYLKTISVMFNEHLLSIFIDTWVGTGIQTQIFSYNSGLKKSEFLCR